MNRCLYFLIAICFAGCNSKHVARSVPVSDASVQLVHLIWRHGDRSPTVTYPNDPHQNDWPDGLGFLTNLGRKQHYELGQYMRERYGDLLGETFHPEEILARSSDADRAAMSMASHLAGLFPPKGRQIWNPDLDWQPVGVHTRPAIVDWVVLPGNSCPKLSKLKKTATESSEAAALLINEVEELNQFLTEHTGKEIKTFEDALDIYEALSVQSYHKMELPEWANSTIFQTLKRLSDYYWYVLPYDGEEQQKLRGGAMLEEVLMNMEQTIAGTNKRKLFLYSGHDSTVGGVLASLNVFNFLPVQYASTAIIELHRLEANWAVKVFYKNSTLAEIEPFELTLPDCESPCDFEKFKTLAETKIPSNILTECEVSIDNTLQELAKPSQYQKVSAKK